MIFHSYVNVYQRVVDFQTKSDAFPVQPGGFPAINAAGWMSVAQIRALRQCSARSQSMRLQLPEQFPSGNQTISNIIGGD